MVILPKIVDDFVATHKASAFLRSHETNLVLPSPHQLEFDEALYFVRESGSRVERTVCFGAARLSEFGYPPQLAIHDDFFIGAWPGISRLKLVGMKPDPLARDRFFFTAKIPTKTSFSEHAFSDIDLNIPEISQIPFELDPLLQRRLCVPTSILMVMQFYGIRATHNDLVRLMLNYKTGKYGIWPQNIYAVNQFGLNGAAILVGGVHDVWKLLNAGIPIVASLRFENGELHDFPTRRTPGHMLVVRGIVGNKIIVNDPVHSRKVCRTYPLEDFMKIWLTGRPELGYGAGLIFWT